MQDFLWRRTTARVLTTLSYVVCLKYIIIPSITVNESFVSFDNVPPAPSPEDVPTMYG